MLSAGPDTVVVVAGGNQGVDDFRFPALFPEAVAVGSVTSGSVRSSRSNYERHTTDPKVDHPNVFYLPGGDVGELIGETDPPSVARHGTLFAAAYATGLFALYLARTGLWDRSRAATLQHFRACSDRSVPKDVTDPGNGMMRLA